MKQSSQNPLPEPGQGKRGEKGYLGYLLRQAAGAHRLRTDRALADLGVTQPQFAVLTMLANYPSVSSADIARLALLTPQTVSVIVANLARVGALVRHPHAVHGRIQNIDLSEKGEVLLAECRRRVLVVEKELVGAFGGEDMSVIRRWLISVATEHSVKPQKRASLL